MRYEKSPVQSRRTFIKAGIASTAMYAANNNALGKPPAPPVSNFECLDYGRSFVRNTASFNAVRMWIESRTTMKTLLYSKALVVPLLSLCVCIAQGALAKSLEELRIERKAMAESGKRLFYDNDGCDALYMPNNIPATVGNFLDARTSWMADEKFISITYCSISAGFGFFTHDTQVGEFLNRQGADYGIEPNKRNIAPDLLQQGTDALRIVADFANTHGLECFWGMRMNDTHDVEHRIDKPYFLYPPLKESHPEWLVGQVGVATARGRWSSVNYAIPEIRDLAFQYVEEVCQNYNVTGIQLDFFRHFCYFASVANGGTATTAEQEAMTALMRRIRNMTEEIGLTRGRPILVAMRLPDSADFCKACGLDIETWLQEGLLDMLLTTGYFRCNPWEYSVNLGHQYDVQVIASLDESRVANTTRFNRRSDAAYRARVANAWAAGVDGISFFNPDALLRKPEVWAQMRNPESLIGTDKLYFLTLRNQRPETWLKGGNSFRTISILDPQYPRKLTTGETFTLQLKASENIAAALAANYTPQASLYLELKNLKAASDIQLTFNNQALSEGALKDGWLNFTIDPQTLRFGDNDITLAVSASLQEPGRQALSDGVLGVSYKK